MTSTDSTVTNVGTIASGVHSVGRTSPLILCAPTVKLRAGLRQLQRSITSLRLPSTQVRSWKSQTYWDYASGITRCGLREVNERACDRMEAYRVST
jgi:hypothetical protein